MNSPCSEALAAASAVASRLVDPSVIGSRGVASGGRGRRRPQSLAGGAAGIALLHIERAYTGHGDWTTVHTWLSAAVHEELSAGPNAGLYFGVPALAFVIRAAAGRSSRYRHALTQLDTAITAMTRHRLSQAHTRIDQGIRPRMAEFDLVRGLTGLGVYHLLRHPDHEITQAVLAYLVRLTEPLPEHADDLPGWWTDVSLNGDPAPDFPGGHGNLGMSHGIAAPLALLSLAALKGITVEGHTEAIGRICAWLDVWQQEHPCGPWWPGFVTREQARRKHVEASSRQRPSWCYGTPGLARAQQLAGLATGDLERQRTAEAAMLGCLRDPAQLNLLPDAGLCHGTAGLLQAAWRMADDASTPDIAQELPRLAARLLSQLPSLPEDVEFLDGHAGVALALHTAGTGTAPISRWDACLLLI
ncbi:lanthionine synthetase C family protein [Thermobifida alba]|uniref:Lantibiotic modifying enzyme n=2 Tax=Thermobifida TaxID=83677 RepID=A0A147KF56_THECS|nr:lanthionine synthetase C family protein [Thermobifida alba]KUP95936.1 lantibiotic modifying enzyme [Thermobifida cellulosilytica TB100]UPT22183.1 lanthionine synthetase C family protein [Thermobifida alba]